MERSVLSKPRHVHWDSQLHSEYRSTYRWHDFKGEQPQAQSVVKQAPQPNPPSGLPLVRGPMEPAMPRRKKYPGVAYKTNDLFDRATDEIRPQQTSGIDRARSVHREEPARAGRRSKSEGPRTRWTDTVEPKTTTALGEMKAVKDREAASTEYRNQFAWPKDGTDSATPRKSISMGALKKAAAAEGSTEAEPLMNHADDGNDNVPPKRYIEDYLCNGQKPVQRKSTFRSALSAFISNGEDRSKDNRKRYKSEYKKKFRPFSQYVYEASKGTFTKCRGSKGKAVGVDDEGAGERMLADTERGAERGAEPGAERRPDSWYREVLDLRKRAGEYKYRGWGTELAPDHITQLYNKQIELWYQVSRRSSLSALSLATTNHKPLPRDEKDGKDSKGHSPKKFRSFRSAPHQSIHSKLQETRSPSKTSPQKQRKKLQGQSFDETATHDGSKPGEIKSEFKSPRRRPRSADPAPVPVTKHLPNGHIEPHPRPHKPTGLPLSSRSSSSNRVRSSVARAPKSPAALTSPLEAQRRSRSVSKVGIKLDDNIIPSHRSASVAKDHIFDDSPIVKSPPEPTRVKSPEQMNMRSPDPVNWTVPLDTGKTFTVTQNVKSDDSVKRPSSDFKTGSIVEEKLSEEIAPVHHQMSPIRTLKKAESPPGTKRFDKTPTTPVSLTPIDETKALNLHQINGVNGTNSEDVTPEHSEPKEVFKKSTEATQISPGVVDTIVVNDTNIPGGTTASEVLDRARTRFDKFWGKKEGNEV